MRTGTIAVLSVAVVDESGAVETDPDTDIVFAEEITPTLINDGSICLNRMRDLNSGRAPRDAGESIFVKYEWDRKWLTGVPDNIEFVVDQTASKGYVDCPVDYFPRHPSRIAPIG
jgi:hypothetical protein